MTVGAASALVLVMALSSMASATTYVAPWKGFVTTQSFVDKQDCAAGKITHAATLSLHTGNFQFAGSSSATTCKQSSGSVGKSSQYEANNNIYLGLKEHFTTGYHNLSINFSAGWTATGSESASGTCPTTTYGSGSSTYYSGYCIAISEVEILAYPYIQDNTNGSQISQYWAAGGFSNVENYTDIYYYYSGGSWVSYNSSYVTSGTNYSSSVASTPSVPIAGYFVGTHSYTLLIDFEVFIWTAAEGWTHSASKGMINAAGIGNGLTLNSIHVS